MTTKLRPRGSDSAKTRQVPGSLRNKLGRSPLNDGLVRTLVGSLPTLPSQPLQPGVSWVDEQTRCTHQFEGLARSRRKTVAKLQIQCDERDAELLFATDGHPLFYKTARATNSAEREVSFSIVWRRS